MTEIFLGDKLVAIMKNLLPITTSSNDFIGLELALIDNIDGIESTLEKKNTPKEIIADTPKTKEPTNNTSPKTKEKAENIAELKISNDSIVDTEIKKSSFSKEVWNELLNDLKKKYTTLYGVLRMAEIDPGGPDNLVLKFKFGFHKKQVDSPQNTAVLRTYLDTYFGISNFSTTTVKEAPTKDKSTILPQKKQNSSIVSTVSNIFDGAELLES